MPHLTAVTIPQLCGIFFVADFMPESLPRTIDWHDWTIVDNVRVEVPADLHDWPDDDPPEVATLCQAKADPRLYRVFKRSAEVPEAEYDRLNLGYAGIFDTEHWGRFARILPRMLEFYRPRPGDRDWTDVAASGYPSRTAV